MALSCNVVFMDDSLQKRYTNPKSSGDFLYRFYNKMLPEPFLKKV